MSKFGQGTPAGRIGVCAQCHNKAEVAVYPGGNPDSICETCHLDNQKLEAKIQEKHGTPAHDPRLVGTADVYQSNFGTRRPVDERERYIAVISGKATEEWVDKFIKEVLTKNVLKFDWKEIIQSERWFSLLDLRRWALEVDPDMEKMPTRGKHAASDSVESLMGEEPAPRKRRNKKQQGA